MKLNIIYICWGDLYYKQLIYSLKSFFLDINKISKKNSITLSFYLDDESTRSLKKNKIFHDLENIIKKINIISINYILNSKTSEKGNKFNILNKIQSISLSASRNFDFVFPIYPDYINGKNSLVQHVESIKQGHLATFSPVICLNYEAVIGKIKKTLEKNDGISRQSLALIGLKSIHNIQKFFIIENDYKFPLTPAWLMKKSWGNNIVMRCYHSTPCIFSTKIVDNYKIKVSIDEDFVENFNKIKNEIMFFKDSYHSLICSLKTIKDPPNSIKDLKGNIKMAKKWIETSTNSFHKFAAQHTYKLRKDDEGLSEYIEDLTDSYNKLSDLVDIPYKTNLFKKMNGFFK